MIKNIKRSIVFGGLVIASAIVAGYRTYELKKLRKEVEENIIEIEAQKVIEDTQK